MCVSGGRKTLADVRSICSVVPLLWFRCQLCWEELSDSLVTSHSDHIGGQKEEGGWLTPYLLTTLAHWYCFLSVSFHTLCTPPPPPPSTPLPQALTSPRSPCPFPPSWWVMSMTLWYCLRLVCPTGRNCCWIPSAPNGTLGTWWFVLTTRPCSAVPRASSETSQLSTR